MRDNVFVIVLTTFGVTCVEMKGENKNISECDPDETVNSAREFVKDYKENEFSVWCNPRYHYEGIGLRIKGETRVSHHLNLTRDELRISNKNLWYHIHVKIDYNYHIKVIYIWKLYVSVDGKTKVNGRYIDWGYANEDLQSVNLTAYGSSNWRFKKPGDNCTIETDNEAPTTPGYIDSTSPQDANPEWIIPTFIVIVIGIAMLSIVCIVYKIKHGKVTQGGCQDVEMKNQGANGIIPHDNYDNQSVSSHESDNSIYGVHGAGQDVEMNIQGINRMNPHDNYDNQSVSSHESENSIYGAI